MSDAASKFLTQLARQIYAMGSKKKDANLAESMPLERYARTMTDEYPFAKPPRGKFSRVDPEQKASWRMLHDK